MPTARRRLREAAAVGGMLVALVPTALLPAAPVAGAAGAPGSSVPTASSSPDPPTTAGYTTRALEAEAARLTARIEARGIVLAKLSERFDAATIHEQAVDAVLSRDRRATASARRSTRVVHAELVRLAVASYVDGAEPLPLPPTPGRAGSDPSLTAAYAAVVAGEQHRTLARWDALGRRLGADTRHLDLARRQAVLAVTSSARAAGEARAAQRAEEALLASVRGRLAVAVRADQAAARRTEASRLAASLDSASSSSSSGTGAGSTEPARPGPDPAGSPAPTASAPTGSTPAGSLPAGSSASSTTAPTPSSTAATTTLPPAATTTPPGPPVETPTSAPLSPPTGSAAPASPPTTTVPAQAPGADQVIAYARAQLGKPYQWGGAGPASFDCSGLVMMAWAQAGIDFPHLAQDQYDLTAREPLSDLLPGDLVFFGTPSDVYHVGLYIGDGEMIDAPETGQDVSVASIYWPGLLGAGRVTGSS